jgi:hypothetical protein
VFKPLALFLNSLYEETLKELLQTDKVRENEEKVAVLLSRMNLVGTLKDLPKVITDLKSNLEKREAFLNRSRAARED